MKNRIYIFSIIAGAICSGNIASAQDVQSAAAAAAKALTEAPAAQKAEQKPTYWTQSLKTTIGFTETSLTHWAAGGFNTTTLLAGIDGVANYKKDDMTWGNHLQMDYGFIYSDDKPFLQKNNDRLYMESKWGYKAAKSLSYSANFDFRSQFSNSYTYKNPGVENPTKKDWMDHATLMSGFFAPAITQIGLGIDWVPNKWLTVNFSPVTGGFTIVRDEELRAKYTMPLRDGLDPGSPVTGASYKAAKFEFGSKLKVDAKFNINDVFDYQTQVVLFSDYLDKPQNLRVNWDNSINWKIAKYFGITFKTFLIYDEDVLIVSADDADLYPKGRQRVQFKEYVSFNFTYTLQPKKNRK